MQLGMTNVKVFKKQLSKWGVVGMVKQNSQWSGEDKISGVEVRAKVEE